MLEPAEEAEMVRLALARDARAWERLVGEFKGVVASFAWSLLGNRADVEDAVQNTFQRVFSGLGTYDPETGRLGPWIATIARHEVYDLLRRRTRQHGDLVEKEVVEAVAAPPAPETLEEEKSLLRAALPGCADNLGKKIWDLYVQGTPNVEIAATAHVTAGTVSWYVCKIKKCLMEKMKTAQREARDRGMYGGDHP